MTDDDRYVFKPKPRRPPRGPAARLLRTALFFTLTLAVSTACLAALAYQHYARNLPRVDSLQDYRPKSVTLVYDAKGRVIAEFSRERRYVIPLEQMPLHVRRAFIAAEDANFYDHPGLDWTSLVRAVYRNLKNGRLVQGGSTITQQTTRALLLSREKTVRRKMKEMILAWRLDRALSKDQILHIYLNEIYLGHGAYGVEAAARAYFDKTAAELTLAEGALIAGLPPAPSRYDPHRASDLARRRQAYVLGRMVKAGFITAQEAQKALEVELTFKSRKRPNNDAAPYFTAQVRKLLIEQFGPDRPFEDGLRVYTTIDLDLQAQAEKAAREGLAELDRRREKRKRTQKAQVALICLDPADGNVKAMVGGRDYHTSRFNRAVQARRQPGSAFKPILFTAAMDNGFTPGSIFLDAPVVMDDKASGRRWKPKNFDNRFLGPTNLYTALTRSRNIIAVRLWEKIGHETLVRYARSMGLTTPLPAYPALALGASEVRLCELASAYTTFPNLGRRAAPRYVTRIEDRNGRILARFDPQLNWVVPPGTAGVMLSMLRGVVEHGTGRRALALNRQAAGKTGTTNGGADAWFVGFTPELLTGVWVGCDRAEKLGPGENGGRTALPIFVKFMEAALKDRPARPFPQPPGVVEADLGGRQVLFKPGTIGRGLAEVEDDPELKALLADDSRTES